MSITEAFVCFLVFVFGSAFVAGLCIGVAILLPIPANAAEYTAVGRDSGEMALVEFDETDKHGKLLAFVAGVALLVITLVDKRK